jgi:nicotinate-nucleotide adenylyltransferase
VLKAITNHTLGSPTMGPLEKILYVADVASEDRGFREAGAVRTLAYDDLDAALREAARVKLAYVIASGFWIHPTGVRFWNDLLTNS